MLPVYYCFIHTVNIVLFNHILFDVCEVGFVFILLLQVISGLHQHQKRGKSLQEFFKTSNNKWLFFMQTFSGNCMLHIVIYL